MQRKFSTLFAAVLVLTVILSACAPSPSVTTPTIQSSTQPAAASIQLTGSGATFPEPLYKEWIFAYAYVNPAAAINYQGIGSGGGKKAIIDGTVDFAGSDSLLADADYTAGKDLQMYPTVAGAVVLMYNIPGIAATDPALVLDGPTLVGIYNGTIKNWNDPAIVKLNSNLATKLPDKSITAVHRSDGSGTTEIFTKALTSFDPAWKAGGAQSVEWPVDKAGNGIGGKGSAGVAAAVQNTPNSLGYVELSYVVSNKITFASMVNKAGQTVVASLASTQAAVDDFANAFDAHLNAVIVNAPGQNSWPIAGYTYLILHTQNMQDCVKAQALVSFWKWALTDANAAKRASDLGYAPLTQAVQSAVLAKMGEVTCNGQKVLK